MQQLMQYFRPYQDSDVVVITEKNFEFETAVDATFVMFYAPWCGFCKRLHPTWEELASDQDIDQYTDVTVAKVDCTQQGDLCKEHGVSRCRNAIWCVMLV